MDCRRGLRYYGKLVSWIAGESLDIIRVCHIYVRAVAENTWEKYRQNEEKIHM